MPIQGKALYLTLSSSGMRIGETLQLKLSDIDLDKNPMQIHIRGEYTKTGNPRHAFASKEAKEAIQEWFKARARALFLLRYSGLGNHMLLESGDRTLFQSCFIVALVFSAVVLQETKK